MTLDDLAAEIADGQSVAFGGGGVQRKPMAATQAIARAGRTGLHLVSLLGGPEFDLLLGLGRVQRISFAFVGYDAYGLAPTFRAAPEPGTAEAVESSGRALL